jgi:hypothetical protein
MSRTVGFRAENDKDGSKLMPAAASAVWRANVRLFMAGRNFYG